MTGKWGATSMIDHISIAVRDLKAAESFYSTIWRRLG